MLTILSRSIPAMAAMLLLSGCAGLSPESRVRAGLVDAGVSPRMADCMARRIVDQLSVNQLRRLQSLASLRNADAEEMSVDHFLRKVRALDDPEIFLVTSKSALVCAF